MGDSLRDDVGHPGPDGVEDVAGAQHLGDGAWYMDEVVGHPGGAEDVACEEDDPE